LLQKIVATVLPEDWAKVLKPVCDYVFRAVFKDFQHSAFPEGKEEK
jgi:hypothetical protein